MSDVKESTESLIEKCAEMIVNALNSISIDDIDVYRTGYEKGRADAIDEIRPKVKEKFIKAMYEFEGVIYPTKWIDSLFDELKEDKK